MQAVVQLFTAGISAITGGGTAAAATTAASAGATAAQGFSLSSLLQGSATALSMFSSIRAGQEDASALELQAMDAEREKPLETLQGIARRTSIKRELVDALGNQDAAYAASGVDLSFGTPGQARSEAFRDADMALTTDASTQQIRTSRLDERARNYRRAAGRARTRGFLDAAGTGLTFGASALDRG